MRNARLHVALFLLALAFPAGRLAAGELVWLDTLVPGSSLPSWVRPNEDLTTLSTVGSVGWQSVSFFVDASGPYVITSDQSNFGDPFDGFLALYAESFDSTRPFKNLIAANDNAPGGAAASRIETQLAAGVIYHLVTTFARPYAFIANVTNRVSGPGTPRFSSCFADDVINHDNGDPSLGMSQGQFCVSVTWKDFAGRTGVGIPVGHRSDDSGLFYFFTPDNWELSVKVLNGCALNHRYWVFLSGSTTVQFEVTVRDLFGNTAVPVKTYRNALGHPANAVTDTDAFAACTGAAAVGGGGK